MGHYVPLINGHHLAIDYSPILDRWLIAQNEREKERERIREMDSRSELFNLLFLVLAPYIAD